MKMSQATRLILQLRRYGNTVQVRKFIRILWFFFKSPLLVLVIPVVIVVRLAKPWLLVRWGGLSGSRIGHLAAYPEIYLCERESDINIPRQNHLDIFFIARPVCNRQLVRMWKRSLRVWPAWFMNLVSQTNRLIPGGAAHEINNTTDRDVHNLLDKTPPHLKFSAEEEIRGEIGLQAIGVPRGAPFVCLTVRDSAYLDIHFPAVDWSHHNYRDNDIQNYVLTADHLANRGYYVIRMGVDVHEPIKSSHPKVIDYAAHGMRDDFMDIYIAAKCDFCLSGGSGFTAVPLVFRRPIVYTNVVALGYLCTFSTRFIGIPKHHFSMLKNRKLTLTEIFKDGIGFFVRTSDYESRGIRLIENTPEEIYDVVNEMVERLHGTWRPDGDDEALQRRFWEIFPIHAVETRRGRPLHGLVRSRIGAKYLRQNREWLN